MEMEVAMFCSGGRIAHAEATGESRKVQEEGSVNLLLGVTGIRITRVVIWAVG